MCCLGWFRVWFAEFAFVGLWFTVDLAVWARVLRLWGVMIFAIWWWLFVDFLGLVSA